MPKLEALDIAFEKTDGIFHAGDRVRGGIVVTTKEDIFIQKITLTVKGEARNGWVNKTSDKIYESMEVYINENIAVLSKRTEIQRGRHSFSFMFALPVHLPSSFEGEYGRIRYVCHATMLVGSSRHYSTPGSGTGEFTADRMLMLISNLNLLHYPLTRHPVEAEDIIDYTCCCVPLGSAQATIVIPKNGYMPRESIAVAAEIKNNSRRTLEVVTITLIQNAKFVAWSRYENAPDTKETRCPVASITGRGAPARRRVELKNLQLEIPLVIPTYRGNIMEISYVLRFEANPGMEIEIPITIGTMNV